MPDENGAENLQELTEDAVLNPAVEETEQHEGGEDGGVIAEEGDHPKSFKELGLSEGLLTTLDELGYAEPDSAAE